MTKTIEVRNVTPKPYKGQPRANTQGTYHAEITPRASIRIFGTCTNHYQGPQNFDRTFKIGDVVEHGSYNLTYTGQIIAIGEKTITVDRKDIGSRPMMMDLFGFIDRNWNFDLEKIAKDNLAESYCI